MKVMMRQTMPAILDTFGPAGWKKVQEDFGDSSSIYFDLSGFRAIQQGISPNRFERKL